MKILFNLLTICLVLITFQIGFADNTDKKSDVSADQKEYAEYYKYEEAFTKAEWSDGKTLDLTVQQNWFGSNSKKKAEASAEYAALKTSSVFDKEICVNIFYPDGKKLANKCAEYKPAE